MRNTPTLRFASRTVARSSTLVAAVITTSALATPPAYIVVDLGTLAGPDELTDPGSWVACLGADGGIAGTSVTDGAHHEFHAFRRILGSTIELLPLSDDAHSVATGTNASGESVGVSYQLATISAHGVRWSANGAPTSLGAFTPRRIADDGTIVGEQPVSGSLGVPRAARLQGAVVTDLGTLGGTSSSAADVNGSGWIVGHSKLATGTTVRAFLWRNGAISDLGTLGGSSSRAEAINASGQVAGTSQVNSGDPHATLFNLSATGQVLSRIDLGILEGRSSSALDITDDGTIVGVSGDRAFRWSAGNLVDLNSTIAPDLSWVLTRATSIDDAGRIAGEGRHFGLRRGFVLVPRLPADFDANGDVNGADLGLLLAHWNERGVEFDLNGDGVVNGADLGLLLASWGHYGP